MIEPVSSASACSLEQVENPSQISDLFKRKRMKGWWPSYEVDDEGKKLLNVSIGSGDRSHTSYQRDAKMFHVCRFVDYLG